MSNKLNELTALEERFRPYLKDNDYTFIGPVDDMLFPDFIRAVAQFAKGSVFGHSLHKALNDRNAINKALQLVPLGSELDIYVVARGKNDNNVLSHTTIDDYCSKYSLPFKY